MRSTVLTDSNAPQRCGRCLRRLLVRQWNRRTAGASLLFICPQHINTNSVVNMQINKIKSNIQKGERGLAPLRVAGRDTTCPPISLFLLLYINTISVVNMQIDKIKVTFKRGKGRQPLENFGFAEPRARPTIGAAGGC